MSQTVPNYRKLSISTINEPQFRHIKLLLYWPVYGLLFLYFERIRICTYHPIESVLDDYIPFVPQFIIPYFFWFVYLIGGLMYFFFKDINTFKRSMWFIIITYSITSVIYFVYPTCQMLRPAITDNGVFEKIVSGLYAFDTNTNVCPSIHVLGSMAVCFSFFKCESINKNRVLFQTLNLVIALLISFSTVFLKQHSIIDVFWGFVLSFAAYPFCIADNKLTKRLLAI